MTKIKGLLLLVLVALLVDFAVENALPAPVLKLFKFELGKLPTFLIVFGSFAAGFVAGWLGHTLRVRRQRRAAAALLAEKPESRQAA